MFSFFLYAKVLYCVLHNDLVVSVDVESLMSQQLIINFSIGIYCRSF